MTSDQKRIIFRTVRLLKQQYADDSAGHGWLHLERVLQLARKLAKNEKKLNHFVVEMAALLHDADDYKFKKPGEGKLEKTKETLEKFEIDKKEKAQILYIVSHVSFKGGMADDRQKTLEGKIVQDADRLDVLGAVGIARCFAYGGAKGQPIYDLKIRPRKKISFADYGRGSPSINHFYEKILLLKDRLNTPQAKNIAENRHKFVEVFLKEFWDEVKGIK